MVRWSRVQDGADLSTLDVLLPTSFPRRKTILGLNKGLMRILTFGWNIIFGCPYYAPANTVR